jgi:hypothetical protein
VEAAPATCRQAWPNPHTLCSASVAAVPHNPRHPYLRFISAMVPTGTSTPSSSTCMQHMPRCGVKVRPGPQQRTQCSMANPAATAHMLLTESALERFLPAPLSPTATMAVEAAAAAPASCPVPAAPCEGPFCGLAPGAAATVLAAAAGPAGAAAPGEEALAS